MCKKMLFVILMLGIVGIALADTDWTNGSGDRAWANSQNWSAGVPNSSTKTGIRASIAEGPIIDSSTTATTAALVCGDWSNFGILDITGGTLTTNGWFILAYGINDTGTFNVSGGTTTVSSHLDVGMAGVGYMNMTAGTVTVSSTFGIATNGGSGDLYLDGGTISCGSFSMATGAAMDITEGTLIIEGDVTSTIDTYVSNGWITAYGGVGILNVDYNITNTGKTTISASNPSEPPTKATNPNPPDGATNVSTIPTLSWTSGTDAESHDVYFGTNNPPAFQGNQTEETFSPAELNEGTVYYWRIDEKNNFGTTTGDVWSFTTAVDSNYGLIDKVMCGYQGWFNCPGDGTTRGWIHWGGSGNFTPDYCSVDFWPDMTEYTAGEKFLAPDFYDGIDHYVFSSHNLTTVRRHFQWMQDYGIDGVYLQRFITECTPGSPSFNHRNDVLDYCKDAANLYDRKYAVMYDLSGLGSGSDIQKVVDDWMFLVDNGKIPQAQTHDPAYMFHQGEPVVAVWGLGYDRAYEGQESRDLIDFLKNGATYGGNTVMLGVRSTWRTNTDTYFQQTLQLGDIISPWMVGRYSDTAGVNNWAGGSGVDDQNWCDSNGKEYLPVMFPGFSWYNQGKGPLNQIPRMGGQFFWDQVYADISTIGATMLYVAMFDEVDEGTAIFKVTNDPPVVSPAQFVTLDIDGYDVASDEYLWLAGQAGKALRGEIPAEQTRPSRDGYCGDGTCDPGEDQCNCPDDCGTPPSTETGYCADGIDNDCDTYTDCDDADCDSDPACQCGNGTCDPGEDQCNCPEDCGTPPSTETSCTDGVDNDCDTYTDCDDSDCDSDPACQCGNGVCDPGEDCHTCPDDCISRTVPPKFAYCCGDGTCEGEENETNCAVDCGGGSYCGDETCDPGEDQCNCPDDCGTPPSTETSCTDEIDNDCDTDVDCDDSDCEGDPACPSCGDGTCDPGEDQCNCPEDCGTPPSTETGYCTDGINNDCDAYTDCDDPDCADDPACSCLAKGEPCTTNEECCSNDCHPVKLTCK